MTREILIQGVILDEHTLLTLDELCRLCDLSADILFEMMDEGLVEPVSRQPWQFSPLALRRVRQARRLQRDLRVNLAGAAAMLDLLDEVQILRRRVRMLEKHLQGE